MGKSPGKWIKEKLFGKKSTKSTISERGKSGKEAFIVSMASSGVVATNDPVISDPQPVVVERNRHNLASGNLTIAKPPEERSTLLPVSLDGDVISLEMTSDDKSDVLKQEKAAAKVQAALRGFLARRAFWALKGIIRLQALTRGHLVRRQAVAALHCMKGIVRFQALVRGQQVRFSEGGIEVKEKCNFEKLKLDSVRVLQANCPVKLSKNAFAQKLLASSPNSMSLRLHYNSGDVNSAWNWLERWSSSHFWELVVEPKKDNGSKASKRFGGNKGVELENGRLKRGIRRSPSTNHDNSSDYGKPRGALKKSISHHAEAAQENPQNELEKVKRNLRKISLTKSENDKRETAIEKPKSKISKMHGSGNHVAPEQCLNNSVEKLSDLTDSIPNEKHEPVDTILAEKGGDSFDAITKEPQTVSPRQQVVDKLEHDGPDETFTKALQQPVQKDEKPSLVVEELNSKEDSNGKENQKARRRKSLSAKHDYPENVTQITPMLPSYMQATQSAKAKLRAQGSPRLSQDTPENGIVRRHSLPSSTGGKLNTPSPRIQKLVQGSGKGGIKSDKSLSASKDYNSNDWRR
ncbi:hypothetical protein QQ045_022764 [Rhodiola kirilowii]